MRRWTKTGKGEERLLALSRTEGVGEEEVVVESREARKKTPRLGSRASDQSKSIEVVLLCCEREQRQAARSADATQGS